MISEFLFCPKCGQGLREQSLDGQLVPVCTNQACGFVFWQNSKPSVAVVIPDDDNHVLLTVRAQEPDKGKLDLPGGFLLEGEHPEAGAKREIEEELGVKIQITDYLGFVIDKYYEKDKGHTLNIGIVAQIVSGTPRARSEIAAVEWFNPRQIELSRLAFMNNEYFLNQWRKRSIDSIIES